MKEDINEIAQKVKKQIEAIPQYKREHLRPQLAPSILRILAMPHDILVEHFVLIQLKASSLSSTQRKRVKARTAYLVEKNKIKQEDIDTAFKRVTKLINKEE